MNKLLLILGITWALYLTIAYFGLTTHSFSLILIGSLLCAIVSSKIIYFLFNKIIKQNEEKKSGLEKTLYDQEADKMSRMKKTECINQLAHYDGLTGLPTRVFFNETLNKAISHAKRRNQYFALLVVDVAGLSAIEKHEHTFYEQLQKAIATRLSSSLRSEDVVAKLGDDEFIILLNDIGKPKLASSVAEKLLKTFETPFKFHQKEIIVKINIGICVYPTDGTSLESLLAAVDMAVTSAKQKEGGGFQFYAEDTHAQAQEFIELEQGLKKAIEKNELVLYFQPKLHIKEGNMVGVEALVRWQHPTLGLISPAKFIPIAEETGYMMKLGEWILHEACRINKAWQQEGYKPLKVSVNLSEKQFHHPDMPKIIKHALEETKLSPEYLEIEITEEIVMGNIEDASAVLEKIKETNVNISLDHFGTGYISIRHLKKLPIDAIKIDQEYIKGIPLNPNDCSVTSALIGLIHNLGLTVVAEGVETAEQVQFLASHSCDIVQGYFLSHPAPADKIVSQFTKITEMY